MSTYIHHILNPIYQSAAHNDYMIRQMLIPQNLSEHRFRDQVLDSVHGDEGVFLSLVHVVSYSLREFELMTCFCSELIDREIALFRATSALSEMSKYIHFTHIKEIWMNCFGKGTPFSH